MSNSTNKTQENDPGDTKSDNECDSISDIYDLSSDESEEENKQAIDSDDENIIIAPIVDKGSYKPNHSCFKCKGVIEGRDPTSARYCNKCLKRPPDLKPCRPRLNTPCLQCEGESGVPKLTSARRFCPPCIKLRIQMKFKKRPHFCAHCKAEISQPRIRVCMNCKTRRSEEEQLNKRKRQEITVQRKAELNAKKILSDNTQKESKKQQTKKDQISEDKPWKISNMNTLII